MATKHKEPAAQRLRRLAEELAEVQRDLSVQQEPAPALLTAEEVAQRLRTTTGRVAKMPSLVARAVRLDDGPRGLRWQPAELEAWLSEQQGRGVAA